MPDILPPEPCPLITPFTRKLNVGDRTLEKLFLVRGWDIEAGEPLPFAWPTHLRTNLWSLVEERETDEPLRPRQYQLQMTHHLARMPRFLCGDAVGLGKTLDAIMAACWIHDRYPQKIIVFATKSSTGQWADEFRRFSTLRPYVMRDTYGKRKSYDARYEQLKDFLEMDNHDVLICKYSSLKGKRRKVEGKFDEQGYPVYDGRERISQEIRRFTQILTPHGQKLTLIFDESHKFKSATSQTRMMVQYFQRPCRRAWGMTATAITNSLEEFYAIATALGITPFGYMAPFRDEFCIYRDVFVGKGRMKQQLIGYQNVARFRQGIRPFFLGRSQGQVKEPLPRLTTVIHPIDLDDHQARLLLHDIPSGEFQLPPSIVKIQGELYEKERDWDNEMTQLSVYQLVANHPALLDPRNLDRFHTKTLSPKEETLLDLLDGDFRGEKCIVYTKYRVWINRLEWLTVNHHFTERKFLRITGAENEDQRIEAMRKFQDPKGTHDLIFINAAATEAVNLQQAAHLFVLDLPWSWGQMLQLVGRMVRMASPHSACTLHILPARGTIDEFSIETLKGKKGLFEAILGESHSAGILDDKLDYDLDSGMEHAGSDQEFLALLKAHAKSVGMRVFLEGEALTEARRDRDYKMTFEPGAKKKSIKLPDF